METAGCDSSRPLAEQVAQRIKDYILEEKLKGRANTSAQSRALEK